MTTFPKPGIVRLKGKEMDALRIACFLRDGGRCTKCKQRVYLNAPDWHPLKADMAHIRNKRMFGDVLSNVKLMCHREHMEAHGGGKPVPKKREDRMNQTAIEVVAPEAITPLGLIQLAVDRGASIDTIERLAKLQREMQEFQAKIDYGEAMTKAQDVLPRIAPDLTNPQTHSKYASYAALDRVVRPVYTKCGFSLSFNTGVSLLPDHVLVLCTVRHVGGHWEPFQVDMPNDGKGAKGGDVMTKTHAQAAATSYGMRYLLKMIFNIAIGEDDKDGNTGSMDESEVLEWVDAIEACGSIVELQRAFKEAYTFANDASDKNALGLFIRAKDKKKRELQGVAK